MENLIKALLARPLALCFLRLFVLNGRKPTALLTFTPRDNAGDLLQHSPKYTLGARVVQVCYDGDDTFTFQLDGDDNPKPVAFHAPNLEYPASLSKPAGALKYAKQSKARSVDVSLLACIVATTGQPLIVSKSGLTFSSSCLAS